MNHRLPCDPHGIYVYARGSLLPRRIANQLLLNLVPFVFDPSRTGEVATARAAVLAAQLEAH